MIKNSILSRFLLAMTAAMALAFSASLARAAAFDPEEDDEPAKAPKVDPADEAAKSPKKGEKVEAAKKLTGVPKRVAFLNFGLPLSAQGKAEDTVGIEVVAHAWKKVIPMLEKDKVDIVVVRINSGGGALSEMEPFQLLFQNEYKKRFQTVAWVENAISCAAMSPWPIEEIYFLPEGRIGACTAWSQVGGGQMAQVPIELREHILAQMETNSRWANRDPKIMRAMQIMEPLSANVDENGNVKFFQDLSGKIILNPPGEIFTMTSKQAELIQFSKGTAATPEELMKKMGISEYEIVGKEATKFIDNNIIENSRASKQFYEYRTKYELAKGAAEQFRGDRQRLDAAIGQARKALRDMQRTGENNPSMPAINGCPPEWFKEEERTLKNMAR